ncbi:hypothetical protein GCK72_025263 [Caenorhabditis remanei]|uniref:Uncharacterized protein n=1 Tax=Caenorhabditis remanei TaxID=31234 RepID=A0A6A5G1G8_CAERE|nr:hypothetical protein GCK72_025263 [Caenorhabditis remanei]KAF1748796.1 hypothetical protein GCK72_025263 [Caenorhabditis remanei]
MGTNLTRNTADVNEHKVFTAHGFKYYTLDNKDDVSHPFAIDNLGYEADDESDGGSSVVDEQYDYHQLVHDDSSDESSIGSTDESDTESAAGEETEGRNSWSFESDSFNGEEDEKDPLIQEDASDDNSD